MILSARSAPLFERPRYQPTRSLALAVAVLVNALVFLKLSLPGDPLPMTQPVVEKPPMKAVVVEHKLIEPIAPPPPAPLAPERPIAVTAPTPTTAPAINTDPIPVVVEHSSLTSSTAIGPTVDSFESAAAAAVEQVTVAHAPRPRYPPPALRRGLEGTVVLSILVGVDGRAERILIQQGSGHRILDQAALQHVSAHWRFNPAQRDGRSVAAWASVPIDFRIAR